MPPVATTISLTDRSYDRVLAVIPIADQPPVVIMTQPTRDTVWRHVPSGAIAFSAHATDDIGFKAAENKVSVHDLHATILYLLGIDHTKLTYRYSGRDFRLTDVEGTVVKKMLTSS